jgi:phosphoribosylanthranilate isomerase
LAILSIAVRILAAVSAWSSIGSTRQPTRLLHAARARHGRDRGPSASCYAASVFEPAVGRRAATVLERSLRVKVCGIRRHQDVVLAAQLGVDAIGLLVGQRHRSEDFLEPQEARELAAACPPLVTPVLVTHHEEPDAIVPLAHELLVTTIQIHSECSAAALRKIRSELPGVRLIRAVHATRIDAIEQLRELSECVHGFIIDSVNANEDRTGGTGLTHDWNLSARIVAACPLPVILAGGLDPTNVAAAIATVRPYGVDANTRLRDADGFKSPEKLGAFARAAKAAFFDLALEGETSRRHGLGRS